MNDQSPSKQELLDENTLLKQRILELSQLDEKRTQAKEQYQIFFTENINPVFWIEMENPIPTHLSIEEQITAIFQQGYIKDASESVAESHGLESVDLLIGARLPDIYDPNSIIPGGDTYKVYENLIQNEYRLIQHESPETAPSGDVNWFINNCQGVVEDGCLVRIWGSFVDITDRKESEEEIKRHKYLLEQSQILGEIGSWSLDVGKNVLIWTDESYKILGIPQGTPVTYEKFLSCIHPDDREYVDKKWTAAMKGAPYDITHRLLMDDGSVKWVREKADLEFDENRNCLSGLGFVQEITERKQAEESQREVKEIAERYLNISAELIIRLDSQGTIRLMNENGHRLLGYNSGELIGKNWFDTCLPKEIRSVVRGVFHKLMNGDVANIATYENTVITKTGDERLLLWYNTLLKDKYGKINGLLCSAQDISERKQAEEHLKKSSLIIDSTTDTVITTDLKGTITYTNKAVKALYGYEPEELVGKPVSILWKEEDVRHLQSSINNLLDGQDICNLENICLDKQGNEIPVLISLTGIKDSDGKVIELLGITRGIKALKDVQNKLLIAKEKAEESTTNLNSLINNREESIWSIDKNYNYITLNNYFKEAYFAAFNIELTKGLNVLDTLTPELKEFWKAKYDKVLLGENLIFENSYQIENELHYYEISLNPIISEDKITGVSALSIDITERKLAQEKLKESEEKYREAQQMGHLGHWTFDPLSRSFNGSPEAMRIYGFPGATVVPFEDIAGCISKAEVERVTQALFDLVQNGNEFNQEFEICPRNSNETRVLQSTAQMKKDEHGTPMFVTGILQDITDRKKAEQKLIESTEQFRNLVEQSPYAIQIHAPDGILLHSNEALAKMYNLSTEAHEGLNHKYNMLQDEQAKKLGLMPWIKKLFSGESVVFPEYEYNGEETIRKLGVDMPVPKKRWIKAVGFPIKNRDGKITSLVYMGEDITNRKKAEEQLRKSEALQHKMVANIGDVIVITDKDGITQYKSPNIETLFGWKPEELVGGNTFDNIHPLDLEGFQKIVDDLMIKPKATGTTELRYKCKDGSYKWISLTIVNMFHDPDINGLLGNYHDISKNKLVEESLLASEELLRKAQKVAHVGSWVWKIKTNIVTWSAEMYSIFGISQQDFTGNLGDIMIKSIHPDDREAVEESNRSVIESGKPIPLEYRIIHPDSSIKTIWAEAGELKFDEDGSPSVLSGIVQDITVRKQAEMRLKESESQLHQAQKMKSIGQLAGGIAHDFNNVLSGIMSASQLLQLPKNGLNENSLKYVEMITKSAIRASDLISKLLAFSRKGKIETSKLDIHVIFTSVVDILAGTIDKKITISLMADAANPNFIGDLSAIESSFLNLGINASHSMPDGGVIQFTTKNIFLDQKKCDSSSFDIIPGDFLQIEIKDTGCGIPVENLQKIFEPFYTTKEQGKGTGLGLSAVYGTIQDHHGMIEVQSDVGVGTTFSILLPCAEKPTEQVKKISPTLTGTGTILLVDDEEINRIVNADILESLGYKVLLAMDGLESVGIYSKKHSEIDIVLLDMIMPKMNGSEAFYKMKEINENCKVIISSGFTRDENIEELIKNGMAGFINKPYTISDISTLLNDVFKS